MGEVLLQEGRHEEAEELGVRVKRIRHICLAGQQSRDRKREGERERRGEGERRGREKERNRGEETGREWARGSERR